MNHNRNVIKMFQIYIVHTNVYKYFCFDEWMKSTSLDRDASVLIIFSLKIIPFVYTCHHMKHECIFSWYSCKLRKSVRHCFHVDMVCTLILFLPFLRHFTPSACVDFPIYTARFHFKSHWICECARAAVPSSIRLRSGDCEFSKKEKARKQKRKRMCKWKMA